MIGAGEPQSLIPNRAAMLEFLTHCFGGYLDGMHDGLIEIACCRNQGDKPNERWHSELFGTDELEEAADYAASENSKRKNIYVCPALRHPDADRHKRSHKDQVMGTVVLWCEWDDAIDFEEGQKRYQFVKPTAGVITGTIPYRRSQAFWRLDTAIIDIDEIDAALIGLQSALFGDPKVTYASSPMRLPGSISWRKLDKPERVDEQTILVVGQPDMPASYPAEQVLKAFPPSTERKAGSSEFKQPDSIKRHKSALGFDGAVKDGRETYMRDTIMACLTQFAGENSAWPTAQELYEIGWPQYSRNASFDRPGRDEKEFIGKCNYTARRAASGQIPYRGRRYTLEDAKLEFIAKHHSQQQNKDQLAATVEKKRKVKIIGLDEIRQLQPPAYVIDETVTEYGFTLVYGQPGCFKSFLALDWLLCMAHGRPWAGREVLPKNVLYIAGEGVGGIGKRVRAWEIENGLRDAQAPFFMLERGINFTKPEDITELVQAAAEMEEATNIHFEIICVDTVARAMVGADEKDSTDMGIFIDACDELRHHFGCGVIAVHHAGKNKELGSRGSNALPAAVDTEIFIDREEGSDLMKMKIKKQKDDDEGPEHWFKSVKINLPAIGIKPVSSLVLRPSDGAENNAEDSSWSAQSGNLTVDQVNKILREIDRAWQEKDPWSNFTQSKKIGRYLPKWLSENYGLTAKEASEYVDSWLSGGKLLRVEDVGDRTHRKGLKVVQYINN